jgi:2-dehydropantoate 2-reductase
MKVTVVGLGAIGGLLAARLSAAGVQVQAVARGAALDAVRASGLKLTGAGAGAVAGADVATTTHRIEASDNAADLDAPDLVIIALKGQALAAALPALAPLWAHGPVVMPAMNGVPWWFLKTPPLNDARPLDSVDPQGVIDAAIPLRSVLGCVVHLTSSTPAPGHVRHGFGERLIVGEPNGGASARCDRVAALLGSAGFVAEKSTDVRRDIWFKLWGNMTMNPVSALTGATCDRILDDPLVRRFMGEAMAEAAAVGQRIGCPIEQNADARMALTRELGAFKTSMLQDCEMGRPLEIDALVSSVHEIALRVGVPTPTIGALLGLTRLMAGTRGLYPV